VALMKNLGQIVGYAGLLLESTIVVRSIQCKSFAKYPVFYTYIVSVLCADLFLRVAYAIATPSAWLFWRIEIVTVALGCGVLLEISRHVFARHISLDHLVRWVAAITFGTIFLVFAVHALFLPDWKPAANPAELERQLRVAQALALLSVVLLSEYYGVAIGKNMRGLILGFGVYVAATLIALALRQLIGIGFSPAWRVIQPSSYLVALLIWTVALWTYEGDTVTTLRF
jgi:hypothetical protein